MLNDPNDDYYCPRCGAVLSKEEFEDEMCENCGWDYADDPDIEEDEE